MAKIVITLDTESKELSATIDGAQVPELIYACANKYSDYDNPARTRVGCTLELKPQQTDDGVVRVNTCINAYANIKDVKVELSSHVLRGDIPQEILNASAQKWLGK